MPNIVDATGLTVETSSEINSDLTTGFQGIYGDDINVASNSPDGQAIGIFTQIIVDVLETLVLINNSFDPDLAVGTLLDQRVAINNITRMGGTYTVQPIDITVNTTVPLQGLDANYNSATATGYTVQDGNGNQFILAASQTLTAGTTTVDFRAASLGPVNLPTDTITIPVTIVLGVTGVNNSSAPLTVGETQETDAQLRTRRQQSPAINSSGNSQGLQGILLGLTGVTEAEVYQNRTDSTDGNGTLAHTIWVVVAGGASSDIGNAIYSRISDGIGMRGSQTYDVTKPDGTIFVAQWDNPTPEPLYIEFDIKTTVAGFSFDLTAIKAYMAANLTYGIGGYAETSSITAVAIAAIASQGGGGVPVLVQISIDDSTWTDYIAAATPASQFTVSTADINITVV